MINTVHVPHVLRIINTSPVSMTQQFLCVELVTFQRPGYGHGYQWCCLFRRLQNLWWTEECLLNFLHNWVWPVNRKLLVLVPLNVQSRCGGSISCILLFLLKHVNQTRNDKSWAYPVMFNADTSSLSVPIGYKSITFEIQVPTTYWYIPTINLLALEMFTMFTAINVQVFEAYILHLFAEF